MKTRTQRLSIALSSLALLIILNPSFSTVLAQGTAFSYEGRLNVSGLPASGNYDLTFALFDTSNGVGQASGIITNLNTPVTNGLFTTLLDFGPGIFTGTNLWLQVGVRTNGNGSFTALSPLQSITPVPYSIYSGNANVAASASSVAAANITGTLVSTQLPAGVLTNGASGVNLSGVFNGTLIGNGTGVTNVIFQNINTGGSVNWATNVTYMTNSVASTNASYNFGLAATIPGTGSPYAIIAADVNGDGKVDLVYSDVANKQMVVMTNNGNGGFVLSGIYPASNSGEPYDIAAADFNGDGKVDLICVDYQANGLTIYTNNGSGGFALWMTVSEAGYYPRSVTPIDVNGTGHIGFACANYYYEKLAVFLNNGNGSFSETDYSIGNGLIGVTTADVNKDGRPDIICCDLSGNDAVVMTNNGSGGFVESAILLAGASPIKAVAVDVNGDGWPDLVIANNGTNAATIYTNNENGGFVLASSPSVGGPTNSGPFDVATADVNGDGMPDLIFANNSTNLLIVLTNSGAGNFAFNQNLTVGSGPLNVVATNLDGGSQLFIVSANGNSNSLSVLTSASLIVTNTMTSASTNVAASFNGIFTGNGSGLTNLNFPPLPANVITNSESGASLSGSFSGNGAGLTNLNYVSKSGDTMSGTLNLPANGLVAGGTQLVLTNGNVGIGTATPNATVHIVGSQLYMVGNALNGEAALDVNQQGTGGNIALLRGNGNVGIGTTSPGAQLDVNGAIRSTGQTGVPASGTGIEFLYNTGGNFGQIDAINRSGNIWQNLKIDGQELLLNSATLGNVGIGTTTPGTTLEVAGTASGQKDVLLLRNTSGAQSDSVALSFVNQYANTPLAKIRGYVGSIGNNGGGLDLQTRNGNTGNYTTTMSIIDNGNGTANVGVGITNPAATLDVNGSVHASGTINAAGGLIIQNVTADPANPAPGQIWLRTDL